MLVKWATGGLKHVYTLPGLTYIRKNTQICKGTSYIRISQEPVVFVAQMESCKCISFCHRSKFRMYSEEFSCTVPDKIYYPQPESWSQLCWNTSLRWMWFQRKIIYGYFLWNLSIREPPWVMFIHNHCTLWVRSKYFQMTRIALYLGITLTS